MESKVLQRFMRMVNKVFMVPLFRLGLGVFVCNPLTGYVMVLRTIGRKSRKVRHIPVNYALMEGSIYCLVGFGRGSQWYKNVMAAPDLEVMLPTRAVWGRAEEVEGAEKLRAGRRVLLAAGFAGSALGADPRKASDEELAGKLAELPVLRIRPTGIGQGSCDHGGRFWVTNLLLGAILTAMVILALLN